MSESRLYGDRREYELDQPIMPDQDSEHFELIPTGIMLPKQARNVTTHSRLWALFTAEWERQRDNRLEMAIDEGFYDHEQWTELERDLTEELGHVPVTINVVATTINWLAGTERRARTDHKILARRKEGASAAERKTHLMKYIGDVNRAEFEWSQAFLEAMKAGVSYMECGVQEDDEGEPIYEGKESWRNCLHDSASTRPDLKDARYFFRMKWMDEDMACSMFADDEDIPRLDKQAARKAIMLASETTVDVSTDMMDDPSEDHENFLQGYGSYSTRIEVTERRRVRMVEGWFRLPVKERRMAGGDFRGEIYDPDSIGHNEDLDSGRAKLVERIMNRMFVVIFTSAGVVWASPSPYRHNDFPFTPVWAYRRARDHQPYGVIRGMRDLQRDVNKRHAHALFMLVHQKIVMDRGAVDDIDALEDEVNRPTAIIEKRPGYSFEINIDKPEIQHHIDMMMRSIAMLQQVGGITEENLGREHTGKSGKAILALQDQGALATAALFDNLRLSRQIHGEKKLSLCEQFMTEKKSFRITNKRGVPDYYEINDGLPQNDIVRTKADFIISEDTWQATMRQANLANLTEALMGLAPAMPEILAATIDLIIDMHDLPAGEEIVKRIRNITGMEDPDADPNAPDPDRDARQAARALQQKMQERAAEAEISGKEATAAEKFARAEKVRVEAGKLVKAMTGENIDVQTRALQLALQILQTPEAADMADAVLSEANADTAAAAAQAQPQLQDQTEAAPPAAMPAEPAPADMAPDQPIPA